jgi:hypothetical protein
MRQALMSAELSNLVVLFVIVLLLDGTLVIIGLEVSWMLQIGEGQKDLVSHLMHMNFPMNDNVFYNFERVGYTEDIMH